MRRFTVRKRVAAVAATAALLGAGALTAPALADGGTPSPSTSASAAPSTGEINPARAKRLCKRVPKITTRVSKALTRIQGSATTKGSNAWLNAAATKADDAGKTALARVLRERAKIRATRIPTLKERQKALAEAKTWCQSKGYLK
jgi:hypothetical protein